MSWHWSCQRWGMGGGSPMGLEDPLQAPSQGCWQTSVPSWLWTGHLAYSSPGLSTGHPAVRPSDGPHDRAAGLPNGK